MFFAYYALAQQGDVNLEAMKLALENTRKTGQSQPGLGKSYLRKMESYLDPSKNIDQYQ